MSGKKTRLRLPVVSLNGSCERFGAGEQRRARFCVVESYDGTLGQLQRAALQDVSLRKPSGPFMGWSIQILILGFSPFAG